MERLYKMITTITKEMLQKEISPNKYRTYKICSEGYRWFIEHDLDGKTIDIIIEHLIMHHEEIKEKHKNSLLSSRMTGYEWAIYLIKCFSTNDEIKFIEYIMRSSIKFRIATYHGYQSCDDKIKVMFLQVCIKVIRSHGYPLWFKKYVNWRKIP